MLNLARKNHCVILNKSAQNMGMIHKVNDYVTWGEAKPETITKLIEKRGRLTQGRKLTDDYVKENTKYKNVKEFALAVAESKSNLKELKDLKPVLRLNPPKGGFERGGIKKPYGKGGVLGYRGDKINELIAKML